MNCSVCNKKCTNIDSPMLKHRVFTQIIHHYGYKSRYGVYICNNCMEKGLGRKISLKDILICPWSVKYIVDHFPHVDTDWLNKELVTHFKYVYNHNKRLEVEIRKVDVKPFCINLQSKNFNASEAFSKAILKS